MASTPGPVYPEGSRADAPIKMRICACTGCFRAIPDDTTKCIPCSDRVADDGTVIPAWHGPGGKHGYGGDLVAETPVALVQGITAVNRCVAMYDLADDWPDGATIPVRVDALKALRDGSRYLYG